MVRFKSRGDRCRAELSLRKGSDLSERRRGDATGTVAGNRCQSDHSERNAVEIPPGDYNSAEVPEPACLKSEIKSPDFLASVAPPSNR